MSTVKDKERAASLIGSIATVPTTVVFVKDTFPRVIESDAFSGDRKKFKAYESQCRMYLWADGKRGEWRNMKTIAD
jgi:hypothetical protein